MTNPEYFLLIFSLFPLICIAFGLFYLIKKAYQNRQTIIRLPFTLYEKFISRSNLLVMFITIGLAIESIHLLLALPEEKMTDYSQFILSPQGHRLLIIVLIFLPRLCRIISRKFLTPMNSASKWLEQFASLWWSCMILLSYIFYIAILCKGQASPINENNEKMLILFTFICFWTAVSSAIRRLKRVELNYN